MQVGNLQTVVHEFQEIFQTSGKTDASYYYYIPTTGPPLCVPPICIPIYYHEEVLKQLQSMLDQGIIKQSSSPWMAPAFFVRKNQIVYR